MDRIKNSITYVFNEKGWENKVLALYIVLLLVSMLGGFLNLSMTMPLSLLSQANQNNTQIQHTLRALSSSFSSMTSFISIPVTLYILGYLIGIVKNVAQEKKSILTDHNDLAQTFINGAKLYVALFIAKLPVVIIGVVLLILSVGGTVAMFSLIHTSLFFMIGIIFLVILTIILTLLMAVLNSVITYATFYIYYSTNSFRQAFNYSLIIQVIQNNERDLLGIFFDFIVIDLITMFASIASIILLCLSFFAFPFVSLVGYFAKAYILGDRFKNMSKLATK